MKSGWVSFRETFWQVAQDVSLLGILGLIFVLSASLTLYVTMHQSVVTVPNLVGKSAAEAQQLAQEAGLELKVKNQVRSDQFPANTVIEQWPRAGMTIKQGQSVRVNVSLGPHDVGQVR